jgi:hypothetical protein
VNQQGNFRMKFTKSGEGRKRNGNEIPDARNIEDDLIGAFFEEPAAEKSNHRKKVLPPFVRLSTHDINMKTIRLWTKVEWCVRPTLRPFVDPRRMDSR